MFQFPGFPTRSLCIRLPLTAHYRRRVSPFGHPRLNACFRLPVAFRRSLRPSSAFGARASTLCSYSLNLPLAKPIANPLGPAPKTLHYPKLYLHAGFFAGLQYRVVYLLSFLSSICGFQGALFSANPIRWGTENDTRQSIKRRVDSQIFERH